MNSLRLYWLLALLVAWLPGAAQQAPAQFEWVRAAYDHSTIRNNSFVNGISTTDNAGNIYTWLSYTNSYELDGVLHTAPDSMSRMALAKLDAAGHVAWVKDFGIDSARTGVFALTTDAAGNVYAVGRIILRKFVLEGVVLDARTAVSGFVAKWSPAGTLQFANLVGTGAEQWPSYVRVDDASGDIYMAGNYTVSIDYGGFRIDQPSYNPLNPYTMPTTYCAKLSAAGVPQWAVTLNDHDSLSISLPNGLGLDQNGNVYMFGVYAGQSGIGTVPFPAGGGTSRETLIGRMFWARINSAGQVSRARTFESPIGLSGGGVDFEVAPTGFSYAMTAMGDTATLAPGLTVSPTGYNDALVFCLDPSGALQWTRQFGGTEPHDDIYTYDLALGGTDRLYLTGQYRGRANGLGLTLPWTDTTTTAPYNPWAIALERENGQGIWALSGFGKQGTYAGQILPAPNGAIFSLTSPADSIQLGNLLVAQPGNAAGKLLLARISERYNTLRGAAYLDANANGAQDAAEGGFPGGLIVEVNPGQLPCVAPAGTGQYRAYVDLASYSASLPNPPAHYATVVQGPTATPFSTYGNVAQGRSFALQPIANQQDVQVFLTQISPARPGWPVVYDLLYRNTGTVTLPAGTMVLTADARLTFTSASVVPATVVGAARTWTYSNLLPGETRRLRVVYGLPNTIAIGDTVTSSATVTPLAGDLVPGDNSNTARRIVSGSFDPNDIEVNHVQLSTQQVQAGEWLEYTIRFQNHGTDTAFTVAIHDTLSADLLRLSTFQFMFASHACGYGISPTGQLVVTFPGIQLPSQATNLLESDGFIRFRVQPRTTLVAGDQIPNQARIHFDYNVPMATNTALTVIQSALGAPGGAAADPTVLVWPNPASGTLHVEATRPQDGELTLTLVDALGRAVRTQVTAASAHSLSRAALDVSGLPAGLYVLRGQGAGQSFARPVVVR